jgi:hypothetical protein
MFMYKLLKYLILNVEKKNYLFFKFLHILVNKMHVLQFLLHINPSSTYVCLCMLHILKCIMYYLDFINLHNIILYTLTQYINILL